MKKSIKNFLGMVIMVAILICVSAITSWAADSKMSITLRIEGINANIFYKTIEVPHTGKLTLQNALSYIDDQEDSINITGVDIAYITDINGETAGKFGGWDGWMFKINGVEAAAGIDSCELSDGDSVVLYYGDPYGVGMQYPEADTSRIADGIIKFSSSDITFDAEYNPIVKVNPIVGATITWNFGSNLSTYTTDSNGQVTINATELTAGTHAVRISKVADSGIPLVLRYAPDYRISVNGSMNITLRVEGINENLFYKKIQVPYNTDNLTLQNALMYIDSQENSITISGLETAYITEINGETAGKFGGWDGWMYKVNGIEAAAGIDSINLSNNDSVVLYYGDPYGVGMQYPEADVSRIADGIIKFTSSDTTFDAEYNPTVTVNPVKGATVKWFYGNTYATYITNDNGEIIINKDQLIAGSHNIQISKVKDSGIPLVLRLPADKSITVEVAAVVNPQTGDNSNMIYFIFIMSAALITIKLKCFNRGRKINEK